MTREVTRGKKVKRAGDEVLSSCVTVPMPTPMFDELCRAARREERSLAQQVRLYVRAGLGASRRQPKMRQPRVAPVEFEPEEPEEG